MYYYYYKEGKNSCADNCPTEHAFARYTMYIYVIFLGTEGVFQSFRFQTGQIISEFSLKLCILNFL